MTGHRDVTKMTVLEKAFSGSLAAVFAALVLCPTELVKCRLQAARETGSKSVTPTRVCAEMWRKGGVASFFVGLTPTLAREVPGYFCFFGVYEASRHLLAPPGVAKDDIGSFSRETFLSTQLFSSSSSFFAPII